MTSNMNALDQKALEAERKSMAYELCLHRGENPNSVSRGGEEKWETYLPLAGAAIRHAEKLIASRPAALAVAGNVEAVGEAEPFITGRGWENLSCDDQFTLAKLVAANIGHVLIPEPDFDEDGPPFITSNSGNGEYFVKVSVRSMAKLHAAHDRVIGAFGGHVKFASPPSPNITEEMVERVARVVEPLIFGENYTGRVTDIVRAALTALSPEIQGPRG